MNWDLIFQLSNLLTLPFWLLMIFAPRWQWTNKIMSSLLSIVPIAFLYVALLFSQPTIFNSMFSGQIQLTDIAMGLSSPAGATISWAHFLAFDLFVGRWVFLDSQKNSQNLIWMGAVLLFTFMLGPIGFLLYYGVQTISQIRKSKKLSST